MDPVGQKTITQALNNMANKNDRERKLQHIIELLKFALSVNDEEIIKSTVESVIELLEEEIIK
jgi:hypothetical protein